MTDHHPERVGFARAHAGELAAASLILASITFGFVSTVETIFAVGPYLNAALGMVVVCYIVHRLLCCSSQYTGVERFGMGMTAAGMVMATPALWMPDTPFDGWSFNVARVGITIYIITGGLRRDRHEKLNRKQRAYALGFRHGLAAGRENR